MGKNGRVNLRRPLIASAVCTFAFLSACSTSSSKVASTTAPTTPGAALSGVVDYTGLTQNHLTTPVRYPQTPPVGGDHSPRWQNCGFYSIEIAPEKGVHSMEHGAVWITFKPDLAAGDIAKIKKLTTSTPYVLASPFPGLPRPVVATAWGHQLVLTGIDDPGLAAFVAKFANSPASPEPGAACSGADGTPEQ